MNEQKYPEGQMQRNITDYINDSVNRLHEWVEVLDVLKDDSKFQQQKYENIRTSLIDVYSRDAIIVLVNLLDSDTVTSSLFTLLTKIKSDNRNAYKSRLDKIKSDANACIMVRHSKIGHFSTRCNSYYNDGFPVNTPISINHVYLKRLVNEIEKIFWEMKEELNIDGVMVFTHNWFVADSFRDLFNSLKDGKEQEL